MQGVVLLICDTEMTMTTSTSSTGADVQSQHTDAFEVMSCASLVVIGRL